MQHDGLITSVRRVSLKSGRPTPFIRSREKSHECGLAASYPVPRLGTALEVADLICFAASEAAGYITGASLDINGGDLMM